MLAVKCTELLEVGGLKGPVRTSAEEPAAAVPAEQWITCSAGHGAKGRRLYEGLEVALHGGDQGAVEDPDHGQGEQHRHVEGQWLVTPSVRSTRNAVSMAPPLCLSRLGYGLA